MKIEKNNNFVHPKQTVFNSHPVNWSEEKGKKRGARITTGYVTYDDISCNIGSREQTAGDPGSGHRTTALEVMVSSPFRCVISS